MKEDAEKKGYSKEQFNFGMTDKKKFLNYMFFGVGGLFLLGILGGRSFDNKNTPDYDFHDPRVQA